MKRKILVFVVLALSKLALGAAPVEAPAIIVPQAAIHLVTDGESEVYAAFLAQAWAKPGGPDAPLARQALLLENDFYDSWQPGRRAWEQYLLKRTGGQGRASDEASQAFVKRGPQVLRFYKFPALAVPVRLVRSDILKQTMQAGGWNGFYGAFPKTQGILSLSAIGFGAGGNEAVFAARLQCGKRCGYRDLVFMRKVNGAWTLVMKDALP